MMNGITGKRVLLVEDDYYEASALAARLEALGVFVVGPAPDVAHALDELCSEMSLAGAILDINLNGEMVFPVADELERRALPFIFATGYERDVLPARYADKILLRKPLDDDEVLTGLARSAVLERAEPNDAGSNDLLGRLSSPDVDKLLPLLEKVHLPRGAILELQGQPISRIYFPLSCIASVIVVGREGSRIEAGLVGKEGMTGSGFVDIDDHAPFELVNQVEGFALTMSVQDFRQVVQTTPDLRLLASRFGRAMSVQTGYTVLANGRFGIPQRLARWLLMIQDRLPDQNEFRLTHDYLAIMLGVRRPSVTDALHILEGVKLIKALRSQIIILDRSGLIDFAGETYGLAEEEYGRLMALPLAGQRLQS